MKKTIVSTRNFVRNHKTALTITTTVAVMLVVNKRNMNIVDEFLKEHDLYDAFWNAED